MERDKPDQPTQTPPKSEERSGAKRDAFYANLKKAAPRERTDPEDAEREDS